MSERALRSLIAHAVVDRQLRGRLLNGERLQVLAQFDLNDHERAALSTFRADSLEMFATQLETWMQMEGKYSSGTACGRGAPSWL
jgi:hypothetical protein